MVLLIKNETRDKSDKINYRPIALISAASEIRILDVLKMYLLIHIREVRLIINILQTCAFLLLRI